MDNENIEAVETAADEIDYFEGWEDAPDASAETDGETEEAEETATPAEDEADEEADETAEEESSEPESKPKEAENQRSWKLKHNGEDVDADEAKMVELAQKGLDYDRVRTERDSFKAEHPKYADYEKFLTELAQNAGTDVPGLMESVRASLLVQQAQARGETLSEAAAIQQVRQRTKEAPAAEEKAEAKTDDAQRKQDNLKAFMEAYPGVKAEDIPLKVLQEGFERGDLAGAYARYENKRLKDELETLKQNQKNKERSTGSRKSTGKSPSDSWFEGWPDD